MLGVTRPSTHELACYRMLSQVFPALHFDIEIQVVLACGIKRTVDVHIPKLGLAIQVDGKQHFISMTDREIRRTSKAATDSADMQYDRDRKFDAAVISSAGKGIKGLLRLHYSDQTDQLVWQACTAAAIDMCKDPHVCSFVMYTPSFSILDQVSRLTL